MMIAGEYVVLKGDTVLQQTRVPQPGWHDVDLGGERDPASLFWKPAWDAGFRPLEEKLTAEGIHLRNSSVMANNRTWKFPWLSSVWLLAEQELAAWRMARFASFLA